MKCQALVRTFAGSTFTVKHLFWNLLCARPVFHGCLALLACPSKYVPDRTYVRANGQPYVKILISQTISFADCVCVFVYYVVAIQLYIFYIQARCLWHHAVVVVVVGVAAEASACC